MPFNILNDVIFSPSYTTTIPNTNDYFNTKAYLDISCKNLFIPVSVPEVKKIIFNNPATIVFWKDGTKTVVKCMEGQPFSEYYGFLCALGKKIYGSNSKLSNLIKRYTTENDNK